MTVRDVHGNSCCIPGEHLGVHGDPKGLSMRRSSSPVVESLPTLLVANHLVRDPLSLVARKVCRQEHEFVVEGRVSISSLVLVFDVGWRFSLCDIPLI